MESRQQKASSSVLSSVLFLVMCLIVSFGLIYKIGEAIMLRMDISIQCGLLVFSIIATIYAIKRMIKAVRYLAKVSLEEENHE